MSDISRRTILKLGALTPLFALAKSLGGAEAALVTPATVEVFQPHEIPAELERLYLDVVIRKGDRVIERYTTTPFAGLTMAAPAEARDGKYALTGFSFSPRFVTTRLEPPPNAAFNRPHIR
jgi:hypothetical protein